MSHFAYIFSSVDRGWFGFGKETQETHAVAELAILAAQLRDMEELRACFKRLHWTWVLRDHPEALDTFMAWVRPEARGTYTCLSDAVDQPFYADKTPRWWPCIGAIGHPPGISIFGYIGYVSGPRPVNAPAWGYITPRGFDELQRWQRHTPRNVRVHIDGFPDPT